MKINIDILKTQYFQIKQIIDSYELNYLNFFNALKEAMDNWRDDISRKYLEQIKLQRNDANKVLLDLKTLAKIYNSIILKYEPIAKQIYYLKTNKNSLYNLFSQYITQIKKILALINGIDLSYYPTEQIAIIKIKNELLTNLKKIQNIYSNIKRTIDDIEKKETEINNMLVKYEHRIIKENEYQNYV